MLVSFYTDCLGQAHWSNPSEIIEKDLVTNLLFIAQVLSPHHDVTTKEIQLWFKYFHDAGSSLKSQKEALLRWYYDMDNAGLLPADHNMTDLFGWLGFNLNDIPSD